MIPKQMQFTIGKFDIPLTQDQPPFEIDLLDSNIILFGSAMSGKTTFIKTFVNILHKKFNEKQEQIFILDFGGALSNYKDFPLVSAYFDNSNEEYVKRLFKIAENILKDNIDNKLKNHNFREIDEDIIHTTLIIENLNAFIDEPRYTAYQEKLSKICRDGLSKGISVVVTASDTKGLSSYMSSFKQKIAFELPQDKYSEIFTGKIPIIGNNPGHGFANATIKPQSAEGNFRMNLPYEVQCFLPYRVEKANNVEENKKSQTEEEFFVSLKNKFAFSDNQYTKKEKKYLTFPKELLKTNYEMLKQIPKEVKKTTLPVSVGLDYVNFEPVTIDFGKSQVVAIYGKKEFGKTNLLKLLLNGLNEQYTEQ
ncbi:MAG: cell division protein FtsK, partial [Oscillospiraceae bacterium]|nr:cell division protein FtsK [Oscillospiraceae bacterium]